MDLFFSEPENYKINLLYKLGLNFRFTSISVIAFSIFVIFFIIWLYKKLQSQSKQEIKEVAIPEHLNSYIPDNLCVYCKYDPRQYCVPDETDVIDLARVNYLNLLNNVDIKASAIECIRKYGVGTCGPREFLGTTENHLELERMLAKFLGMEAAIIYSYGFTAPSNSIVAYCKKGDVVFCDEKINFALEQGLLASKALIIFFLHNNVEDLRNKLESCNNKLNSGTFKKFLLIEGIYDRTGSICPLPEILQLATLFKLRVFLDESISIGILGSDGCGITQHFSDVNIQDIDMIIGSLEGAIGSVGSFCAGSKCIIEQQRVLSAGYMFSASLPAFQAEASLTALQILEKSSEDIWHLQLLSRKVQQFFTTSMFYTSSSDPYSPHKVFHCRSLKGRRKEDEQEIYTFCQNNNVNVIANEDGLVINLNVSLYQDKSNLSKVFHVLKTAVDNLKQKNDAVDDFAKRQTRSC